MVARKPTTKDPPFSKDSAEGILLDQIFRTAGVDGGLGAADPYHYSPAAIKMMPGFDILRKLGDSQFRQACARAAAREIKRRMKTGEVPKPERANFFQPAAGPSATGPTAGSANQEDDTVTTKAHITHDWDLIEGTVETIDAEYYFVFCQLPWATKKEQLAVVVSEDGNTVDISKKKSRAALHPGALLAAFNVDTRGRARHGMSDVRTVAVNKAIKSKQQQSIDPTAYVSMQTIELPWEAERKLHTYKIAEVPVEDNQTEVWLYIEVKRIGDQYVAPADTPSVPSSKPSASMGLPPPPPPSNGPTSSGSSAGASNSNSNNNNMNTPMEPGPTTGKRTKRSESTATTGSTAAGTATATVTSTTTTTKTLAMNSSMLSQEQIDYILQQQQQAFAAQMAAQQLAMEKEMRKLHVQMGQLHVHAAAFQSIPRGMPPPGIAMGPHFTPAQIAGAKDESDDL